MKIHLVILTVFLLCFCAVFSQDKDELISLSVQDKNIN
jgi:hypothetical protein